jgi:hypothetical protein
MAESFLKQFNDPLGIREKSSRPETFEQTVEGEGEDDVAALQARSFSGREGLAKSYGEERRLIGKQEGLERNIYRDTANLVAYRNEQELFKARQQELAAKADSENITKMIDEIRSSPLYKQKEETNKQIAEYSAFVPTEVTAPMLGVLFATIGAAGMLLGGNNKNTAKAALSAMNGMAEGFSKGREQYDKERKQAFDTNVKLLQTKLSAINDGLEDARKEAVLNKQAAELKVRETLASNDAQFLQENTNRRGLESTIELVKGQLKSLEKALGLQQTKTRQIEGQLNRDAQALENRKIAAAHSEVLARDARQARAEEARARATERQTELQQKQKKLTPVGMRGDNIVMADELGNITLVPTGKGFVPKPGIQRPEPRPRVETPRVFIQDGQPVTITPSSLPTANVASGAPPLTTPSARPKEPTGEKAPAGIENAIKQNAIISENMRSTISSAEDLVKKGKLKSFGFIEGRIPYDIVQQFTSPEELRFIAQMNSLTNQQLKLQSGATVTAAEFARQKGVLPLVTDKPETVVIKLKLWQDLIDTETKVLGRAYPETVKRYSPPTDRLAERMDQAGATPGVSDADERSQAQSAILKIQNSKLTPEEKEKRVKNIESSYKQRTGREL